MQPIRLKLSTMFLLGLGLTGIQAQVSVNATGGSASGNVGSASYSVGQVLHTKLIPEQTDRLRKAYSNPIKYW